MFGIFPLFGGIVNLESNEARSYLEIILLVTFIASPVFLKEDNCDPNDAFLALGNLGSPSSLKKNPKSKPL